MCFHWWHHRESITVPVRDHWITMDCGGLMITALRSSNSMIGLCTDYPDPDIWYPEVSSKILEEDMGKEIRPTPAYRVEVSVAAILVCNECPSSVPCLEAGMLEENLNHGIWGGLMVSERRTLARLPASTEHQISDVKVSRFVRKKLREIDEENNS